MGLNNFLRNQNMNQTLSFTSLQTTLSLAFTNVISTLVSFVPQLLAALIVFTVGLILSSWIKSLIKKILQAVQLSTVIKNSSLERFLKQADIRIKVEELVGEIFRWLIIYIFLIASVNILGLTTVSDFLTNILSYLPRIVSASLIFALSVIAAGFTESLVKSAIMSIDVTTGRLAGKIASYTVVVFGSLVAIGELGIAERFINTLFIGFVAMLSLGLGLAFGLGAKDVVREVLMRWYDHFRKDVERK